jgi:hypothetical protein
MTVYAVNQTRDNISDAYRYGDVKFVNIGYVYSDQLEDGRIPDESMLPIRASAAVFEPEHDYLLIVGDHLQLVAFVAELALRHAYFQVLRYDRKEQAYTPVRVDCQFPA